MEDDPWTTVRIPQTPDAHEVPYESIWDEGIESIFGYYPPGAMDLLFPSIRTDHRRRHGDQGETERLRKHRGFLDDQDEFFW